MQTANAERKLVQDRLQHRNEMLFADGTAAPYHFPLRDLVNGVDVIDTMDTVPLALMHGVYAQVARLAIVDRPAALADGDGGW